MRNYAGSALMLIITMAAAIGSYTVNLRVSAERSAVEKLQRQLVADAREIRTLQVELRTRARFPEMQRWNDGVFQMSAPSAGQYLRNPVQLASFGAAPAEVAPKPAVTYAVTAPAAVPAPSDAPVTVAYAQRPAAPVAVPDAARLIRAGYTKSKSAATAPVDVPALPPVSAGPVELLPDGGQ